MATPAPPVSARGHVSTYDYATVLDELTADLPADLIWPTSIQTYASMRRDSRLTAILAGYGLQIRRAQWQLDPAGCRPEVVQQVADDLGLPVKGRDEPTAARVRGVSWHEHLRAALLSHVYGHSGFELAARPVDGRALLAGLYERPPWTIGDIHADPKTGQFLGVTQDAPSGSREVPQIGADRMVWYCREREGANWAGTSLLRASFPIWLIRREMMRVHATANRRFGMGVPAMEALPNTNPTPAQMAEAMQLASAARVGDQAGAATPPGFVFKLVGLSGGVPDTLAFIEFLGREMATSVLMQHLDLGTGSSGSRALGTAFIDSWTLALGAEADQIADTATRQIAARVVAWNWGDDEPVPQVVASGVGTQREVTAESLQLLMSSGALSSDPGLEAWVRREYRLPDRAEPTTPVVAPGADLTNEDGTPPGRPPAGDAPAAPGEPRVAARRRRETPGQLTLPVAATADPAAAVEQAQQDWGQARDDLAAQWPELSAPMVAALLTAAVGVATVSGLAKLSKLAVPASVVTTTGRAITASMTALAALSARRAVTELADIGVTVRAGRPDPAGLRATATATAQIIADGYTTAARRTLLLHLGDGVSTDAVQSAVRDALAEMTEAGPRGWTVSNLAAALSAAQHAGRAATYAKAPASRVEYVAEESGEPAANRCKPCSDIAGRRYPTLAAALADYPTGRYRGCLGRDRCRGRLVAVPAGGG